MSFSVYPNSSFTDSGDMTLDTNSINAVTASLNVEDVSVLEFTVDNISGGSTTHEVVIEMSPDDIVFHEHSSKSMVGLGMVHDISCSCAYVRLKVKVAEGGASSSNVRIQGK